jgi:hypothetical protein
LILAVVSATPRLRSLACRGSSLSAALRALTLPMTALMCSILRAYAGYFFGRFAAFEFVGRAGFGGRFGLFDGRFGSFDCVGGGFGGEFGLIGARLSRARRVGDLPGGRRCGDHTERERRGDGVARFGDRAHCA